MLVSRFLSIQKNKACVCVYKCVLRVSFEWVIMGGKCTIPLEPRHPALRVIILGASVHLDPRADVPVQESAFDSAVHHHMDLKGQQLLDNALASGEQLIFVSIQKKKIQMSKVKYTINN